MMNMRIVSKMTTAVSYIALIAFIIIVDNKSLPLISSVIANPVNAQNSASTVLECKKGQLPGKPLTLNKTITAPKFMEYFKACEGWSFVEDWGMWSDGKTAKIVFNSQGINPSKMIIKGRYFIQPKETKVTINDVSLGRFNLTDHSFNLKKLLDKKTPLIEVTLEFSNPVSPLSLNLSKDPRQLEYGLQSIEFK